MSAQMQKNIRPEWAAMLVCNATDKRQKLYKEIWCEKYPSSELNHRLCVLPDCAGCVRTFIVWKMRSSVGERRRRGYKRVERKTDTWETDIFISSVWPLLPETVLCCNLSSWKHKAKYKTLSCFTQKVLLMLSQYSRLCVFVCHVSKISH